MEFKILNFQFKLHQSQKIF